MPDRPVRHAGGGRGPARLDDRSAGDGGEKLRAYGERIEPLADRVLVYTRRRRRRLRARSTGDGFGDISVLVRRASLEDVFLDPHRPDAGGLTSCRAGPVLRVVEREVARLQRGCGRASRSRRSSQPAAVPRRDGARARQARRRATRASVDRCHVLGVRRAGLAGRERECSSRRAESMWPVLAGVKWMRFYYGVVATPIEPRELFVGFVVWTALRVDGRVDRVPRGRGVARCDALGVGRARDSGRRRCVRPRSARRSPRSRSRRTPTLSFPMIMRLGVLPLFLFSGTFFPISQLPSGLAAARRPVAAVARRRARTRRDHGHASNCGRDPRAHRVLGRLHRGRRVLRRAPIRPAVDGRDARDTPIVHGAVAGWRRRPWRIVERNVLAYRRIWYIFLSAASSNRCFFLLSIGIGVGKLVGEVQVGGRRSSRYRSVRGARAVGDRRDERRRCSTRRSTSSSSTSTRTPTTACIATPLGAARHRARRDRVGVAPRRDLLRRVLAHDAVRSAISCRRGGRARVPGGGADRIRVRRRRARGDHVHAVVRRLRLREHGDDPAVPVLGHVLPVRRSTRAGCRPSSGSRRCTKASCSNGRWSLGDLHWTLLLNAAYLAGDGRCRPARRVPAARAPAEPSRADGRGASSPAAGLPMHVG